MKAIICITLLIVLGSAIQFRHPLDKDFIDEVNKVSGSWTAGYNKKWEGMTNQQILHLMGTIMETPEDKKLQELQIEVNPSLPSSFDARQQWPNCQSISDIRDQSECGSCWAFGAVEAFSDRLCIVSGQTDQTRISAEDLLSCCLFTCGQGCNGGSPSAAWSWFERVGCVSGFLYENTTWCQPYAFPPCEHHEPTNNSYPQCPSTIYNTPSCSKTCIPQYTAKTYAQDKRFTKSSYSLPNNADKIATEIETNGPIECAFNVYEDFLSYTGGVYVHKTGQLLGGHAIKILGWGVLNNLPYWLVANSWNDSWGLNGYFLILKGFDECGIEQQCTAGIPK